MSVPASFNDGDAAWVLICAALVLFMVPGLALFYAGMVRSCNALTMMLQNMIPVGVVSVLWVLFGYSIAFSRNVTGFIGDLERFGLGHLGVAPAPAFHRVAPGVTIPAMAFVVYHHVSNLPGSAGPHRPAAPTAPAPMADGNRLVTTLVDPYAVESQEMTRALLRAGESFIVVSEVHHYSGEDEQIVRGQRKTIDFPDRLRVEVLAPEAQLQAVLTELHNFSSSDHGDHTRVISLQTVVRG